LGKYGSKSAPDIARALELPRTETYHVVNSLQSLGLVTAELTHPTKYSALEMKEAITSLVKQEQLRIDSLADKEGELSELWKQIPVFAIKTDETKQEKMQLLQGSGPITNKIKTMISESMESIKIYCSRQDASRFYHSEIFDLVEKSHAELEIIITPTDKTPDFLKGVEDSVRVIPKNTENKCFIVSDSKEVLMFLRNASHPSHRVFACWSDSDSLIDMMTSLFELSWENGEVAY
jgi:sugar-specific transcriptional regulator TrmB